MEKYTIGLDFGTLSARALLVRVRDGREIACAAAAYPHGVMDQCLPSGKKLPADWALQDPADYLQVLETIVPQVMRDSGADASSVIGVGIDFTASTTLPVLSDGTPLCFLPAYREEPHAYVKLWKHHAAQRQACRMTDAALERKEPWLARYGGKVSSEWSLPKLWQVLEEAPAICDAMAYWMEAGDWIVWQLTGEIMLNACCAGYKAFYDPRQGYPGPAYFAALDPRLAPVIAAKLRMPVRPLGSRAGRLTDAMARKLGLTPGTAVAVAGVDAHIGVTGAGILSPGHLLMIMGTSACYMVLGRETKAVPGICGMVEDGLVPGFIGFEAGQSCMGDHFAWLAEHCCPSAYQEQARAQGLSIHAYLTQLASRLAPGESGLLALDWWNGNRSVLVDADLTGLMLGLTLRTTCEEMYRALIEATAFGARMIAEDFSAHGVPIHAVTATGGISRKNAMMMQIYADVLNMPIAIMGSEQGSALGSAIHGAAAAGGAAGGYDTLQAAMAAMAAPVETTYVPTAAHVPVYDELFREYKILHDAFGRGENQVMKRLKAIKQRAASAAPPHP